MSLVKRHFQYQMQVYYTYEQVRDHDIQVSFLRFTEFSQQALTTQHRAALSPTSREICEKKPILGENTKEKSRKWGIFSKIFS